MENKAITSSADDPMAFLDIMRARTSQLLEQLDPEAPISPRAAGKENTRISTAAVPSVTAYDLSLSAPPSNFTTDEEVEWWRRKIAVLSAPVGDEAKSVPKQDSGTDSKPALGAKRVDSSSSKMSFDDKESTQKMEK